MITDLDILKQIMVKEFDNFMDHEVRTDHSRNCVYVIITNVKRDKLNSQFIVTKFLILHAGGRSLFRFQVGRETRMAMLELEIARATRALERVRSKVLYTCIYCIGFEI